MRPVLKKLYKSPRMRMIIVGAISLVASYLTFVALVFLGVHYLIASVCNFIVYWIINFVLNRSWSFASNGNAYVQAVQHMSLHLSNQVLIMAGLFLLVEVVLLHPAWAQIVMQVLVTVLVFLITPWIFRK